MSNKPKKYHIYVNYFIQNDSWESISHPNLFVLPQEFTNLNDVKAQMVYDNFPLKNKESYYLRFFLDDKTQGVKGWVDFPPSAVIPIYNEGHVYVKVLRLPKGTKINFKNADIYKPKDTTKVNKDNKNNLIFIDDVKPPTKPQTSTDLNNNIFSDLGKDLNIIGNFDDKLKSNGGQVTNPPPQPQPQPPINLDVKLETNQPHPQSQNGSSLNLGDWGPFTDKTEGIEQEKKFDDGMKNVDSNLFNVFQNITPPQNTKEPIEAPAFDFTMNNKSNNNGIVYPIDNIPSNLSEDELKEKIDPIIMKWTLGGEGKKNLLFLLTTLHEVWTCTNLKMPDMQTLVNDKASVRTYYKKAMRELHSDKNSEKDNKTKYIASCLYQILNEANSNY